MDFEWVDSISGRRDISLGGLTVTTLTTSHHVITLHCHYRTHRLL